MAFPKPHTHCHMSNALPHKTTPALTHSTKQRPQHKTTAAHVVLACRPCFVRLLPASLRVVFLRALFLSLTSVMPCFACVAFCVAYLRWSATVALWSAAACEVQVVPVCTLLRFLSCSCGLSPSVAFPSLARSDTNLPLSVARRPFPDDSWARPERASSTMHGSTGNKRAWQAEQPVDYVLISYGLQRAHCREVHESPLCQIVEPRQLLHLRKDSPGSLRV